MKYRIFSLIFAAILGASFDSASNAYAREFPSPMCKTFSIYSGVRVPPLWKPSTDLPINFLKDEQIIKNISKLKGQESFSQAFASWEKSHPDALTAAERHDWLRCLNHYVSQDTNGDGVPDWSVLSGGQPTFVLYPQDEDIDGDGSQNILDPEPFDPSIKGPREIKSIPAHLKIHRAKVDLLQESLFQEFGIIAIDHSDQHSAIVLENLLFLLRRGFPPSAIRNIRSLRYVYAFSGHDASIDIAAYHPDAKAMSIGGLTSYPESEKKQVEPKIEILTSLAHEMGHAFLFNGISPIELHRISKAYGGWESLPEKEAPLSLYAPIFFMPHPLLRLGTLMSSWQKYGLASNYSARNIHEWFADAFAASILNKLGREKNFGDDWQTRLVGVPKNRMTYPYNYNHVLKGFSSWLEEKFKATVRH